jgi:hypothetical protein
MKLKHLIVALTTAGALGLSLAAAASAQIPSNMDGKTYAHQSSYWGGNGASFQLKSKLGLEGLYPSQPGASICKER